MWLSWMAGVTTAVDVWAAAGARASRPSKGIRKTLFMGESVIWVNVGKMTVYQVLQPGPFIHPAVCLSSPRKRNASVLTRFYFPYAWHCLK
jgi:hypothetical protein